MEMFSRCFASSLFVWISCGAAGMGLSQTAAVAAESAEQTSMLPLGLVDVTVAPFHADPSGQTDATKSIRKGMEEARNRKCAVFFPPGVYSVSDTLERAFDRAAGRQGKDSPCMLIGSKENPQRPTLRLAPNSAGYQDTNRPKMLLHIWALPRKENRTAQPNISMNQIVLNLDIEIGSGNPGAVAIRHDAAQGSGIEDVTIRLGDGLTGIVGLQAGGGGTHNVTVLGGSYGIDALDCLTTAPTVSGVTLIDQRKSAVRYDGLETLCRVGARIVVPKGSHGPAIQGASKAATKGTMAIIDTQIAFAEANPRNIAVETSRSVYLGNVWLRGAGSIVRTTDGGQLPGNASDWREIREYARGVRPPPLPSHKKSLQLEHVSYINGTRTPSDVLVRGSDGKQSPGDLVSKHVWVPRAGWGIPGVIDVKQSPYNAKRDGTTDDTDALQRAMDEHDVVLLPKGRYAVSRTLKLRDETLLVGLRQLSMILPLESADSVFVNPDKPQPIVESPNDADAHTALAYIGIAAKDDSAAYMLHWQSGCDSVVRSPQRCKKSGVRRTSGPSIVHETVLHFASARFHETCDLSKTAEGRPCTKKDGPPAPSC